MEVNYRFPKVEDAVFYSFERQKQRYEYIRPFLGENAVGAEIGVFKGGFGEFLRQHTEVLYLVDPWIKLSTYWGDKKPENSVVKAFIQVLTIYQEEIEAGRVKVVPDFSVPFLDSLDDEHLDWIYLDASHKYEDTLKEIRAAIPKIKKGGYLLGDDFDPNPESKQHGVYLAVNQIISEYGYEMPLNNSRQWGLKINT